MINKLKLVTIWTLALLYVAVGVKHFTDVDFFLSIMPDYLPWHEELVYVSGFFEVLFGIGLVLNRTRKMAAFGIILLLVAVFPANIYLAMSETAQAALGTTQKDALIRLPFQLPLILLAYWHSQESAPEWFRKTCLILFVPTIVYFLTL